MTENYTKSARKNKKEIYKKTEKRKTLYFMSYIVQDFIQWLWYNFRTTKCEKNMFKM